MEVDLSSLQAHANNLETLLTSTTAHTRNLENLVQENEREIQRQKEAANQRMREFARRYHSLYQSLCNLAKDLESPLEAISSVFAFSPWDPAELDDLESVSFRNATRELLGQMRAMLEDRKRLMHKIQVYQSLRAYRLFTHIGLMPTLEESTDE